MGLVSPELLDRSRYPFRHEITTRFANVDPNQHINNVALFAAFECADGKWLSIGSIEPQFYALLRQTLGLTDDAAFDAQMDRAAWPVLKAKLAAIFLTRTRDEWAALMEGTDICFAPVLSLGEAPHHPHNIARSTFIDLEGAIHPAPAPRYSKMPLDRRPC